jgi:hypothetical protein
MINQLEVFRNMISPIREQSFPKEQKNTFEGLAPEKTK